MAFSCPDCVKYYDEDVSDADLVTLMDIFESTEVVNDTPSIMTSPPPVIMAYVDANAQTTTAGYGRVAGANSVSLADFVDDNANDESLIRLIDTGLGWGLGEIPDTKSTTAPTTNVDEYFEWLKNECCDSNPGEEPTRLVTKDPVEAKTSDSLEAVQGSISSRSTPSSTATTLIGGADSIEGFDWDDYINRMIPEPLTITSTTSPNGEELESYDWDNLIAQMVPADWSGFNWANSYLSDDEVLRNLGDWCHSLDEW